mmetsp:Transcript_18192/g.56286  ORF Transcript_18192/g.56286 Transcript_18192/m.56286 type:complete len:189 (+) Transcript_18192:84-650(+)
MTAKYIFLIAVTLRGNLAEHNVMQLATGYMTRALPTWIMGDEDVSVTEMREAMAQMLEHELLFERNLVTPFEEEVRTKISELSVSASLVIVDEIILVDMTVTMKVPKFAEESDNELVQTMIDRQANHVLNDFFEEFEDECEGCAATKPFNEWVFAEVKNTPAPPGPRGARGAPGARGPKGPPGQVHCI